MKKWVDRHKFAVILTLIGVALWVYTGIGYFLLLAPVTFFVGIALRKAPRIFLWAVLTAYASLVIGGVKASRQRGASRRLRVG